MMMIVVVVVVVVVVVPHAPQSPSLPCDWTEVSSCIIDPCYEYTAPVSFITKVLCPCWDLLSSQGGEEVDDDDDEGSSSSSSSSCSSSITCTTKTFPSL